MGYLTHFSVYNDGCDQLEKHPEKLAKILYDACNLGFINRRGDNQVGLGCYANLITVQEPRHASWWNLYFHSGNILTDVSKIREGNTHMLTSAITQMEYELKRLKKLKKDLEKD